MSIVVFQHVATEDAARLGEALDAVGHRLRFVRLDQGQDVPSDLDDVDGVVSMGGPMNVGQLNEHPWIEQEMAYLRKANDAELPIVGVCLGAQLIATALGGEVAAMGAPEVGWGGVRLAFPGTVDPIFAGVGWNSTQFHLHGQEVTTPPAGAALLASSHACKCQAFRIGQRVYGFQFHFEWTEADIEKVLDDPLLGQAGVDAEQVRQAMSQFYPSYRRLGDRLCERMANLLFPIDKR